MVNIEFLSANALNQMDAEKKLSTIIAAVKNNKILVLEEGLSREEERELFTRTMKEINKTRGFTGIEIVSMGEEVDDVRAAFIKMLGGKTKGFTIVGPEKLVKEVKRDPQKIGFATSGK
ncbi:hypothetical protein COT57_01310 [Candidatus Micrarchaeota archaeon CG09_land_8_20_14_0_10_55_25]|nr:MAG: hypothetical protein AUJ15_03160 [Candidatus Micrarchaeota archaeon CG1_02_55_41]PIO02991.1 MAG: hypothetical protein COT57_01310 [Candidatus Micrarchaeota archaeon CG09_land_8_20_14_0_10_55_25]